MMYSYLRMGATLRVNRCTASGCYLYYIHVCYKATQGCLSSNEDHRLRCVFNVYRVYRLHERLVNLRSDYNLRLKSAVTIGQVNVTQSSQQTTMKMRPELDDVTLRYVQDLLAWVEENQRRIEEAEWGSDLPTVESQLGSHRGLHQTVEDFRSKIERAKADEVAPLLEPLERITHCPRLGC